MNDASRRKATARLGWVFKLLILFLVFVLTPGATEIVENAAHLVANGHGAHAVDDAEHSPVGDEHGCSSTFHTCSCHSSTSFVLRDTEFSVPPPEPLDDRHTNNGCDERLVAGFQRGVFRPPAA